MSRRLRSHIFWGSHSPMYLLSAIALLIMASGRLSFALVSAAALIWVYGFTTLVFSGARSIMPKPGEMVVLVFLASFFSGMFAILIGTLNPVLFLSSAFFLLLIPPCCLGSGFFQAAKTSTLGEALPRALLEATVLGGIIIAFALIREPLGMGTFSIPGGPQGVNEVVNINSNLGFFPGRFLSVSAGGLILFGYGAAVFKYFKIRAGNVKEDSNEEELS